MKTPITYYGGKQQLAETIISMIPNHKIYCEPFFGGGAVFFAKNKSYLEVINDKNDLLITFYKECIENFRQLYMKISNTLHSESEYKRAKHIYLNPKQHEKSDIAWAVWVVTNMSLMGTPLGGWKRDNGTGGSHYGITLENKRLIFNYKIHERLKNVQISCADASQVIKERDTPDTFFYLDPPYINCDQKHYKGYTKENFIQLLDILSDIDGKFILSNFMSNILMEYIIKNEWSYNIIKRKNMIPGLKEARTKYEVLVYNYKINQKLL